MPGATSSFLLLVAMPFVTSTFLFLVGRPGSPKRNVLAGDQGDFLGLRSAQLGVHSLGESIPRSSPLETFRDCLFL